MLSYVTSLYILDINSIRGIISNIFSPNEIRFCHEKAGGPAICGNIDETRGHYSKLNKPEQENKCRYDLNYILKLISSEQMVARD